MEPMMTIGARVLVMIAVPTLVPMPINAPMNMPFVSSPAARGPTMNPRKKRSTKAAAAWRLVEAAFGVGEETPVDDV